MKAEVGSLLGTVAKAAERIIDDLRERARVRAERPEVPAIGRERSEHEHVRAVPPPKAPHALKGPPGACVLLRGACGRLRFIAAASSNRMKVLGIAGSLRRDSYNKRLLRAAVELAPAGLEIEVWDRLRELPPFDQDQEADPPDVIQALKAGIAAADGLLIVTPEYNYGVPGVLKNAIDWASRPSGGSPLVAKPVAIMGAAPTNFGTVRAQLSLRQSFLWIDSDVMRKPEVMLFHAQHRFDEHGALSDENTVALVRQFLEAFERHITRAQTLRA